MDKKRVEDLLARADLNFEGRISVSSHDVAALCHIALAECASTPASSAPAEFEEARPNQKRALGKGLAALEAMAGLWAAQIRLSEFAARLADAPADQRAERIAALVQQGFIEGAYRQFLEHKDDKKPTSPVPVAASDEFVDKHLNATLRASGSALRHYSMHKTISDMREALRAAPTAGAPQAQVESSEAEHILSKICDMLHIGSAARSKSTVLENMQNLIRRDDCLSVVEREFFMVPREPDEDFPSGEPVPQCLLRWGASPAEYVEQFRSAFAALAATPPAEAAASDLEGWVNNQGWAPQVEAVLRDGSVLVRGVPDFEWEIGDEHEPGDVVRCRLKFAATPSTVATEAPQDTSLTHCVADRDGECVHRDCPQLRDNEPIATGRHCPLDVSSDDD